MVRVRKNQLPVPDPIHIQGPKGIPIPVHSKGKPGISILNTVRIRTFSDRLLPQPDHILRGPASISLSYTPIHQRRVRQALSVPSQSRVMQDPASVSLFLVRLVRIGTGGTLMG